MSAPPWSSRIRDRWTGFANRLGPLTLSAVLEGLTYLRGVSWIIHWSGLLAVSFGVFPTPTVVENERLPLELFADVRSLLSVGVRIPRPRRYKTLYLLHSKE